MNDFHSIYKNRCKRLMNLSLDINQSFMVLVQLRELYINKRDIINMSPVFYSTVFHSCSAFVFVELSKMFNKNRNNNEGLCSLLLKMKENSSSLDLSRSIESNWFRRLTDTSANAITYPTVNSLLCESLDEINKYEKTIKRVKKLRDKYYAHSEIMTDEKLEEFLQENELEFDQVEELIVLNMNICNGLYKYFCDSTMYPLFVDYDDLKRSINYIEQAESEYKKQLLSF